MAEAALAELPYRGTFGAERPAALAAIPLPPAAMPSHDRGRPLKAWRYVGVYGAELMICIGTVRVGPARQEFWAVWDRQQRRLLERTSTRRRAVRLEQGRAQVSAGAVQIELALEETAGIEAVARSDASYAWTRKQGGIRANGFVALDGARRTIEALAVIDDTAAYYARHTSWRWSAGVGSARDGRAVAWNLVSGVNDSPRASERTVWIDGVPNEVAPSAFAEDLSSVDGMRFSCEAVRERRDNMLLVRSRYRQPFGTFSGTLPCGLELADGYGVMEAHDAWW